VQAYDDQDAELEGLVQQVRAWLADGVESSAIGVAARYRYMVRKVADRLKQNGLKAYQVPNKS